MSTVTLDREGAVAVLTLRRPAKLNAIDVAMLHALGEAVHTVEEHAGVRVVVLEGAGPKAFCVGADINAWSAATPLEMWRSWTHTGHRIFASLQRLRVPVIAAVHGYVLGGGLELALTADLRIAAEGTVLGLPEVAIGTVPGWGGTHRLPDLIGRARAKEMILLGERINAAKALEWGLINAVVPAAQLRTRAMDMANRIATCAPVAVQVAKDILNGNDWTPEALAGALTAYTDDGKEGVASFKDKRPPKFTGT